LLSAALLVPTAAGTAAAADTSCTQQRTAPVYVPETSAALTDMGYQSIWHLATGRGVMVAVVDSGINVRNAHLPADTAVVPGATFVGAVEGWAPDATGRNDLSGHGTAVASLIAGRPVQGSGQVGLARDAQLLPVQVFGISEEQRSGDEKLNALLPRTEWLAAGIRTAAERGAKVINVSLSLDRPDPALADAVTFANQQGALVVASAGDRGTAANKADGPRYPAAFPNVLSVTAVTSGYHPDVANNIQGDHITVAAPGQGLNAALNDMGDCVLGGAAATSYATPLVSATAALLAQKYPNESPAMWKYRIESSAQRPLTDTRDPALGWGIVSPFDALTMTLDPKRPGPTMPGHAAPPKKVEQQAVGSVEVETDPNASNREVGIWIAFLTLAGVGGLRLVRLLRRGSEARAS
jgi:subtilisin family serine protease